MQLEIRKKRNKERLEEDGEKIMLRSVARKVFLHVVAS
jgi:hypothetical protein